MIHWHTAEAKEDDFRYNRHHSQRSPAKGTS